jgi:hypothetical protein
MRLWLWLRSEKTLQVSNASQKKKQQQRESGGQQWGLMGVWVVQEMCMYTQ